MLGKPTRVWEAEGSLKQIAATCCWVALGPAEFTELAFLRRVCSNTPTAFRGRRIFGVGLLQQLLNPSTYSAPLSSPQVPRFSCILFLRCITSRPHFSCFVLFYAHPSHLYHFLSNHSLIVKAYASAADLLTWPGRADYFFRSTL